MHFGFYETPTRLIDKAAQVGLDLASFTAPALLDSVWQSPLEEILDVLADRLLAAVQRRAVQRLFIDGLNGFQAAAAEPERLSRFFTALTHELRRRNVTTLFSVETRHAVGPEFEVPLSDVSAIVENIVFLRYVELRAQLYRLLSILKVRERGYDSTLHEFTITDHGLEVAATAESAEAILSGVGHPLPPNPPPSPASQASALERRP